MADPNPGNKPEKRVFISYSHEPPENAEFVRGLAAELRLANFSVWLDEEEISAGGDIEEQIKAGARASDVGIFVVTARWLERERNYIRHEVSLFGNANARRLAILRERADITDLGPHFATVKSMEWFPNDPQRFSRLWEIYCGIVDRRPGPRAEWEENGKLVFGKGAAGHPPPIRTPPHVAPEPQPQTGRIELHASGRPIACIAGGDWTYLVTDQDEWDGIRADGALHPPIPPCSAYAAAAVNRANELLVAAYDNTIARLRGQEWELLEQPSPTLCFATGPSGILAGMASGAAIPLESQPAKPAFRMRDPVVAIAPFEGGMLAIGSRGMFGRVSWPVTSNDPLRWISTADLGRPVGFFSAMELNHTGVYSPTRMGVFNPETESIVVCPRNFDEGIHSIAFLGPQVWTYAVLTDSGNLIAVDASLNNTRSIRFPQGVTVAGCAGWTGSSLAWSTAGRLYRVSAQGVPEVIAGQDVVLAYCPFGTDRAHVVRWSAGQNASVEVLRAH